MPLPAYVKVPHPEGLDGADLLAIFTDAQAPSRASLVECDEPYRKLLRSTVIREEWLLGARELVRAKPIDWHWCFYGLMLNLEDRLKSSLVDLEDRQKAVVETFSSLTPLARAFWLEYGDSRYLRWATYRYRRLSEYVFYRRLELAPDRAIELGGPVTPFGALRPGAPSVGGVLAKYGISNEAPPVHPSASVYPFAESPVAAGPVVGEPVAGEPVAVPSALPSPLPSPSASTAPAPPL
jgi:hypothetical protein